MARSKSPREGAPEVKPDPQMRERAREAQANRSKKQLSFLDKYAYHLVFAVFGVMMLSFLVSSFWKSGPNVNTTLVNEPSFIDEINSKKVTFTVGEVKMFDGYKLVDAKYLINNQASNKKQLYRCNTGNKETAIPETYNFRTEFPDCKRTIIQQGNCSSSYALASVAAINDRWCRNNKEEHPILSPQASLACDKVINKNCKEGYVSRTLDYAKIYGLVEESCYAYSSEPESPEVCQKSIASCQRHKISDYCVASEEEGIKQEIINYGPVISVIPVYRDFLIYKNGLYQVYPGTQKFSSGHAVTIIGWDVQEGHNCWLMENTWGEDWGNNGVA